ncbi:hypothetical protein GCM10027445_11680 [Amycolatopsis endophytica]|uniref:Uncharacterized protein n=1 Tax=Amycolatopsis endophytica TaxID=860233 RepID=A0A853B3A0_9PSEU|nr:hypothetical protein [Amycolatopsis endophytica]NYI89305.1 hypothetical protein [Amycolatopsis endophytica]
MNDEVSVTELLAREGWTEQDRKPRPRFQVVAVMLAVVLGCGLAAILVKVGADTQTDDQAAVFNLPHSPTGGLAGGGLPNQNSHERTNSSSQVVVTNESPGADDGDDSVLPWETRPRDGSQTETVTVTGSDQPPAESTDPGSGPGGPSSTGQTGTATGGNTTTTTTPPWTPPSCLLGIICVG